MNPSSVDIPTLWKHKGLLFLSTFAAVVLGAAAVMILKPGYEVGSRLWVERLSMPSENVHGSSIPKDFIPTQAEIIRSPAVLNVALAKLDLPLEEGVTYEDVLTSTMERLSVDPLIGTNVLSVRFRDGDRQRAIDTVEAIIDCYQNYVQVTEKDTHRETLELLTQQDEKLRGELAQLHEQQRKLREQIADATQVRESAKVRETMLADVSQTLSTAKSRRIQLEHHIDTFFSPQSPSNVAQASRSTNSDLDDGSATRFVSVQAREQDTKDALAYGDMKQAIDVLARMSREDWLGLEDPTPLRTALLDAKADEARTIHKYGPKHPNLKAVQGRINDLNERLRRVVESAPQALERELASIRRHEQSLTDVYEQALASIQKDIEKSKVIDGYTLKEKHTLAEIQRVQTSHDALSARMNQWELVDQAVGGGRLGVVVRMLEEPSAIQTGIQAPLSLALGISGLLGLMGGAVVVSQLAGRDPTRDGDE